MALSGAPCLYPALSGAAVHALTLPTFHNKWTSGSNSTIVDYERCSKHVLTSISLLLRDASARVSAQACRREKVSPIARIEPDRAHRAVEIPVSAQQKPRFLMMSRKGGYYGIGDAQPPGCWFSEYRPTVTRYGGAHTYISCSRSAHNRVHRKMMVGRLFDPSSLESPSWMDRFQIVCKFY